MVSRLILLLAVVCLRGTAAANVTTPLPWPSLDNLDDPASLRAVLSTVLGELAVARGEREALRREAVEMRADYTVLKAKVLLGGSTNEDSNEGRARRVRASRGTGTRAGARARGPGRSSDHLPAKDDAPHPKLHPAIARPAAQPAALCR